jgi:Uma2 family endonuclease
MATLARLTAEEYFKIRFPEREAELVHGILTDRPMPDSYHSFIQARLSHLISAAIEGQSRLSACLSLRMRLGVNLVRLLDLSILDYFPNPDEAPTRPPVLAVEIVSKDDVYTELLTRLAEYRDWGVEHIWLIDPRLRQLSVYQGQGLVIVERLELPALGFRVKIEDLLPNSAEV